MTDASRDENHVTSALGTSSTDSTVTLPFLIDPITGRLLTDSAAGAGTVTEVSVVSANGFAGTVADETTTPAITLTTTITGILKGNGTAISAATGGTDYTSLAFKTISVSGQSDIVADTPEDTLTLVAGTGITITTNAGTDAVTINSTGGVPTTITVADEATDTTCFLGFFTAATGDLGPKTNTNMTFNSNTGVVTFASSVLTTTDINGGTIDGVTIGGTSAGAITGTTITASTGFALGDGDYVGVTANERFVFNTAGTIVVTGADLRLGETAGTDTTSVVSVGGTQTLTNKRVTPRLTTVNAPGATPSTNSDNVDIANFTGLATAITSMTTNLSGTPTDGQKLEFRFTDDGTARGITWGASFAATTVGLPTTTVISTMLRVLFEWDGSVWRCIAVA